VRDPHSVFEFSVLNSPTRMFVWPAISTQIIQRLQARFRGGDLDFVLVRFSLFLYNQFSRKAGKFVL
jgi:hypothetical protein